MSKPKISIVTVVYNNAEYIDEAIESVLGQDYRNIEYLVIDGASNDGTLEKVRSHKGIHRIVSEPDRGMYDALNKGIGLSTGDYVGVVHSDDRLAGPGVISRLAAALDANATDCIIGDAVFVDEADRVRRVYRGRGFRNSYFAWGMMPPHTTFFARRSLFDRLGGYDPRWKIAADFELTLRFLLIHGASLQYEPMEVVRMRFGGKSTSGLRSNLIINREIREICALHNVKTSYLQIYSKYFMKIWQYAVRP